MEHYYVEISPEAREARQKACAQSAGLLSEIQSGLTCLCELTLMIILFAVIMAICSFVL
jgi:hypothetical protein